jgi:hypothetical protein
MYPDHTKYQSNQPFHRIAYASVKLGDSQTKEIKGGQDVR